MNAGPQEPRSSVLKSFAWPLCALCAVLAVCATFAYVSHRAVSATVSVLRGDYTQRFASYSLEVKGKAQLALCSAKRVELLKMTVPNKLSHSEISIVMPVEYTYYVDMKGKWSLAAEDGVMKVVAPPLGLMAPAPDLTGTAVVVDRSVFDFGRSDRELDALKAQAAARLRARGLSQEALKEVREAARAELADFVSTWLLAGRYGKVDCVQVRFADEPQFPSLGYASPKSR